MKKNLLITGRPGVGKTTLLMKVIEATGLSPNGFYTEEIRVGRDRKGFRVKTFSGKEGILAHVEYKRKPSVGKYGVDVEHFETIAIPEVEIALGGSQIIVIDEIGKMELFSQKFKDLVQKVLDSQYLLLAVISEFGDGFLQEVKIRPDVRLFTLTVQNRDFLIGEILSAIQAYKP